MFVYNVKLKPTHYQGRWIRGCQGCHWHLQFSADQSLNSISTMEVDYDHHTVALLRRFLAFFQNSPKRTCNGIANQGTPRGSPVAFLAPPPPQRTPLDPLGVCRCWGYNFRLGNLFYYYEKT